MNIEQTIVQCTKKMNEFVNCNFCDTEKKEKLKTEILQLKETIYNYQY